MRMRFGALVACAFLAAATLAFALEIPPRPQARLSDYAGLIDPPARAALEAGLERFESATTSQIAVAIFPSLEGESLEDFTNRVFAAWTLGQAGRDNGVLLAIFIAEKRARIEVGYGLEGALTDAVSARVLRERLTPAFREGRYADGIASAVEAIEAATRGEFTADAPPRTSAGDAKRAELLRAIFIFALIVVFLTISNRSRGLASSPTVIGPGGVRRVRGGGWGGGPFFGGFGGGGGGGSWGGGGGFSGGGGSSGGGGASGGW